MYRMVIADDENIIRQGLKHVVDWNELGFEVSEVFSDGQEVIEYLEYMTPDVILTDIKMVHLSGLDVARYVHKHEIPCKVVLISGYQEFELAVQGMKYGVEDYLLKPTNVDQITETFGKLKNQLDAGRSERERRMAERERMEETIPLLKERFFADLVLGGVVDSKEYIRSRINILYPELDAENSFCFLADIVIQDYEEFMQNVWEYSYDQLEMNLLNFLMIYKKDFFFHMVYKSGGIIEMVGIGDGSAEGAENSFREEYCSHAVEELLAELESSFKFRAVYEIRQIYGTVFEIGKLQEDVWAGKESGDAENHYLQEQKRLMISNVTVGNIVMAQKLFHNILDELANRPVRERNNMVIEILSNMNEVISQVNEKLHHSLQTYFNYSALASMSRPEDTRQYCDRIFDRIRMADEKKEYYDTGSLINKAKEYILANIGRDISQEETANHLFICPSYLSRLFRKQTGENFTQYVTRMKIEKSIELLADPQYKTYQVSEALGYKTPRYFSRLFRMQTGMNPSEYRGKVLHLGDKYDED